MKKLQNWLLAFILAWPLAAWTAAETHLGLPMALDLQADARQAREQRVPILVIFGSATCPHCHRALKEYLVPMHNNAEYRGKVIMRYVEAGSALKLNDFSGAATNHKAFTKMNNVAVTPTIKLFDSTGAEVSEPLVGLLSADFYGAYLDRAIDEGLARIRTGIGTAGGIGGTGR